MTPEEKLKILQNYGTVTVFKRDKSFSFGEKLWDWRWVMWSSQGVAVEVFHSPNAFDTEKAAIDAAYHDVYHYMKEAVEKLG